MTENKFVEEVKKLGININDTQLKQLNRYYELLVEWNEKMNLTNITIKEDVYLKHFYDSLTIQKVIDLYEEETLCDIGTGAGFPGLVLKILFPNLKITLVDALNKRITFLNEVIKELNLENIETIHARIEEYGTKNREKYDVVTARAVSKLNILLEYAIPLAKPQKYFISLKGHIEEEIINAKNAMNKLDVEITKKEEFLLPIENSSRTIIMFKKRNKTNLKYPRRYSEMLKKPL